MRTVGLIVEYNPLHYGHVHHFEAAKRAAGADASIAVMSGHFLQRGEPALIGKWARAEAALHMGVDLVLELPVRYSTSAAEWFAYGAVASLHATGIVDSLCYGSELGELDQLRALAEILAAEPAGFRQLLQEQLRQGISYPAAYSRAIATFTDSEQIGIDLGKPNNSLGLHYLIALQRLNSRIEPYTIPRIAADYHQSSITDERIASATAIRQLIVDGNGLEQAAPYLPPYTRSILAREFGEGRGPVAWDSLAIPLFYQLLNQSDAQLEQYDEVDEGLQYRITQALSKLRSAPLSVPELLDQLKTKRYTRTKLQRMLLRILLQQHKRDFTRTHLSNGPGYLRVLGFNARGRELLSRMKQQARWPIVTTITSKNASLVLVDVRATSIYSLAHTKPDLWQAKRDYYQSPIQL